MISAPADISTGVSLDDRLCFSPHHLRNDVEDVAYVPLDRISVRPMPKAYHPAVALSEMSSHQLDCATLQEHIGDMEGCVFSLQCGKNTHMMAAASPVEAQVAAGLSEIHTSCMLSVYETITSKASYRASIKHVGTPLFMSHHGISDSGIQDVYSEFRAR